LKEKTAFVLIVVASLAVGGCLGPTGPELRAAIATNPHPAQGEYPMEVAFDARGSTGDIVKYLWSFGDEATGSGATVTHVFASRGTYTVVLTVVDREGRVAQGETQVWVHSKRPQARFSVSPATDLRVGMRIVFDAGASSDPDGTVVEYRWDFGDGTSRATSAPQTTHVYGAPGVYPVTLIVVDGEGDESVPATRPLAVSRGGCCGN